jgi:trehalose 6-phosphate synthase/phosphatase
MGKATSQHIGSERLVVVSNRLPMTLRRTRDGWRAERSPGGLATTLAPILERQEAIWIGWPGASADGDDAERREILDRWALKERLIAVEIPREIVQGFYEGYANQTLWPLFHHFPARVAFNPQGWEAYGAANRIFLETLLEHVRDDDLVWIHDYHLMLLPQLLREARPNARIGFFLHIPFPASEVFRVLPRRDEILRGLCGADLLAFHTHGHLQHFRASLLRVLGIASRMDRVEVGGRPVRLEALPIGIAPEDFTRLLEDDERVAERLAELRRRFEGRCLLLAVDRLDYTKGIPERLRTFRRLLERVPDLRGQVVLVQVAVPTREAVSEYEELRHEVNELVGAINGDLGTPDWTPVVYIRRAISRTELVALYAASDVGWVTPLRDGMNLVAKEFVACQPDGDAVLVLSEFAGAASEMGEAFIVNPHDEERTAATIERALSLTPEERRERMFALRRRVLRNNAFAWGQRFLDQLRKAAAERAGRRADEPKALPSDQLVAAFREARCRWLLLDYDGSLVAFAARPRDAAPPAALVRLLGALVALPATHVALVSGRPRRDLEPWFAKVAGLWLVAEHGALLRSPKDGRWEALRPSMPADWMERVRPVLEHFVDRTPGSFVEEKECSLVWHYRMSDPEFGEWLANELAANLEEMLAETELRAVRGQKSVEVRLAWASKAEAVKRLGEALPAPDFRLAVGDDQTDEDLFEQLPPESWTIHVGTGRSRARFQLANPDAVVRLLTRISSGT